MPTMVGQALPPSLQGRSEEVWSKCKGTFFELGRSLHRLEELIVKGTTVGATRLTRLEEIEKENLSFDLTIKLKEILPVLKGFDVYSHSIDSNQRKKEIFKVAREVYKASISEGRASANTPPESPTASGGGGGGARSTSCSPKEREVLKKDKETERQEILDYQQRMLLLSNQPGSTSRKT